MKKHDSQKRSAIHSMNNFHGMRMDMLSMGKSTISMGHSHPFSMSQTVNVTTRPGIKIIHYSSIIVDVSMINHY